MADGPLERWLLGPDPESENQRRRAMLALCLVATTPVLAAYSVVDVVQGRRGEGIGGLALAALLLGALLLLRVRAGGRLFFRLVAGAGMGMLTYQIHIGAGEGNAFLWFFVFPLIAFAGAGEREGLLWVVTSIIVAAATFALGGTTYAPDAVVRFLSTYTLVALLALGLETSRRRSREAMLREKEALAEALAHVRRLRGLLPICCSCKRIRDDKGYWTVIEEYIREHADVDFSHGLCPPCRERLYPEVADEDDEAAAP